MFKNIVIFSLLVSSTFAMQGDGDAKADAWRNGFITAYKAMEVDTQVQGLKSSPLKLNQYIIYFDANKEDVATWDKLMIQMFGYTSSITKPIRTTNNWIIFSSYDNKASAAQELEILNQKIFKNSKEYKLQLFDNKEGRVFTNAIALLASQLKELEAIMLEHNKLELEKAKQNLEDNQKVAVIYIDPTTGKIVERRKPPTLEKAPAVTTAVAPSISQISQPPVTERTKEATTKATVAPVPTTKKQQPETKKVEKPAPAPITKNTTNEKPIGSFTITQDKVYAYKIKTYSANKSNYALEEIEPDSMIDNPFTDLKYSRIITDQEGGKYVKVLNKQQFISFEDIVVAK